MATEWRMPILLPRIAMCALAMAAPHIARAQAEAAAPTATLAEIVVTAQKRAQNPQDVGVAIAAFSGQQLAQAGVDDLKSLVALTPGVQLDEYGGASTVDTISIRGVTQLDFADHEESPNAVYVDGSYVSFMGAVGSSMFDVRRVEVLYGPQGTLFGRNATGGLIQIISQPPTDTFDAYANVTVGEFNEVKFEGAVGGPLSDRVKVRFSAATDYDSGYAEDILNGSRLFGDNSYSARTQVLVDLTDQTTFLLTLHGNQVNKGDVGTYYTRGAAPDPDDNGLVVATSNPALYDANCTALGYPAPAPGSDTCLGYRNSGNPFRLTPGNPGSFNRNYSGATGTFTWTRGSTSLTSISDYQFIRKNYSEDSDGTPANLVNFSTYENARQASQEVRLAGSTVRSRWVVGVYYLDISGNYQESLGLPIYYAGLTTGPDYGHQTTSKAVFSQGEYDLVPGLTLIAGARWSDDTQYMNLTTTCSLGSACPAFGLAPPDVQLQGGRHDDLWSGKLELDWHLSDAVMLYGGVTQGTKGGVIQAPLTAAPGTTFQSLLIKPEILRDFEAGLKSMLLDGRARLNAGVFYYDYHDYQAFTLIGIAQSLFNANATVKGGQLEFAFRPIGSLTLSLSGAYTDGIVKNVTLPSGVIADQQMPVAPHVSLSSSARYEWPFKAGKCFFQLSGNYVGARYFNSINNPAERDGAYFLGGARAGYISDGNWDAELFVDNFTNRAYEIYAAQIASTDGGVGSSYGPPRWAGARFSYHWK